MSIIQIVLKTVITTIDLCLLLAAIKVESSKGIKPLLVFVFINLMGVWI